MRPYPEAWKYERCYELETYRMGRFRVEYTAEDVRSMRPGVMLLDVGCGRGEILEAAKKQGLIAVGVETVKALCDNETIFEGDATDLIFTDDSFEYLTCYDVLEHLIPGDEQKALDEFKRVCKGTVFLSTNNRPSWLRPPNGEAPIDLHINKRSQAEWHNDIIARWPNAIFKNAGPQNDWHWTCPA